MRVKLRSSSLQGTYGEFNSSPYIALLAIERLVSENCTNASHVTLEAVENNRNIDDLL